MEQPNKPINSSFNEFRRVNRTTSFLTITLTIFFLGMMTVTMLMTVNFDVSNIQWFDFIFSLMNWIIARTIYFPVGTDIGNGEQQIILLSNTINKYRNIIYKHKINKQFREKLDKYNLIAKCSSYMDFIDNKLTTTKNKKQFERFNQIKQELLILMPLIENDKMQEYKGFVNLDIVKINYDKLEFANIFSFGEVKRQLGERYTFNASTEGISRSTMPFLFTSFASFFNASIVVMSYGFTVLSIYMFAFKIIMFALGAFDGIKLGKEVILQTKYAVMLNLADRTKEIITELEEDMKVILDE